MDPTINAALPSDTLLVEAIGRVFATQPLPPATRAQIWALLAQVPQVDYLGAAETVSGARGW